MAINEISLIKLSISLEIGVSAASADEARFAIYPITVLSPVLKHIPVPEPAVHDVPKKPTFFVSKIFWIGSLSKSINISSDSPVKEALFTFISLDLKITMSHGMFSPVDTITISPGTINLASIFYSLLFLIMNAVGGIKFSNYAMISADLDVWA
jgi:hypothetical protein